MKMKLFNVPFSISKEHFTWVKTKQTFFIMGFYCLFNILLSIVLSIASLLITSFFTYLAKSEVVILALPQWVSIFSLFVYYLLYLWTTVFFSLHYTFFTKQFKSLNIVWCYEVAPSLKKWPFYKHIYMSFFICSIIMFFIFLAVFYVIWNLALFKSLIGSQFLGFTLSINLVVFLITFCCFHVLLHGGSYGVVVYPKNSTKEVYPQKNKKRNIKKEENYDLSRMHKKELKKKYLENVHKKEEENRGITDELFTKLLIQLDEKYPDGSDCSKHPTFEMLDNFLANNKLIDEKRFLEFIGIKYLTCECEILATLGDIGGYPEAFEIYCYEKYEKEDDE